MGRVLDGSWEQEGAAEVTGGELKDTVGVEEGSRTQGALRSIGGSWDIVG